MATNAMNHYHDDDSSIGSALPPDADQLLKEEMMKLSLEERNRFQEEIHGVQSLAKEESPEFLRESLRQLDLELKSDNIPYEQRKAYLKSQTLFSQANKPTYVNTQKFRLRFLRCTLFDIPTAASQIALYLSTMSEFFGDYALQRPIRLCDFSKTELREFRKGRYQFMPYRDRAGTRGRRIISVFPDDEWGSMSYELRTKIFMYLAQVAAEDIETQKNGIVVLVWFDNAWEATSRSSFASLRRPRISAAAVGVRFSSIHICTPDTPKSRFRRSMMMFRIGLNKSKVKIHVGTSMELMYALQGFGIPVDYISVSFTGKVKEKYVKEWMRLRQVIEDERQNRNSLIESPYLDDIIFRNGTSLLSHPGNVTLRSTIVEICIRQESKTKNTKDLVVDIISEMKSGSGQQGRPHRFLIWNDKGWWKEVSPENEQKELHSKISRIVRNTRKMLREQQGASNTWTGSDSKLDAPDQRSGGAYRFVQSNGDARRKRQKMSSPRDCFGSDEQCFCNNFAS